MRGQAKWCWQVLPVMVLVLALGSTPGWAQEKPAKGKDVGREYFALSAGIYQPQEADTDPTALLGIRYGYRFHPQFGFEAALSGADLADTLPNAEESGDPIVDLNFDFFVLNLDISLQWFPKYRWGRNVIIFGGAGMSRTEADISGTVFDVPFTDKDTSNIFTMHGGIAYDWRFGDHLFLRPELRYREFFDDDEFDAGDNFTVIYNASGPEANVILGWRL